MALVQKVAIVLGCVGIIAAIVSRTMCPVVLLGQPIKPSTFLIITNTFFLIGLLLAKKQ